MPLASRFVVGAQMVALQYGGYTISPMVIENIGQPLVTPRTSAGGPLQATVQMVLSTLTALDSTDWRRARAGRTAITLST